MNITERDRNAPWWVELKAELESRLAKHRESNDKPASAEATAELRGQIKEIKSLILTLGMGKPQPKIENE
jgi:hypothetical protein